MIVQREALRWIYRRRFLRLKAATIFVQSLVRGKQQRERYLRILYIMTRMQVKKGKRLFSLFLTLIFFLIDFLFLLREEFVENNKESVILNIEIMLLFVKVLPGENKHWIATQS